MSDFIVTVKVRNARLLRKIRAGFGSAAEFSRASGVSPQAVSGLLTMRILPITKAGDWTETAYRIAAYLRCDPEEIWPTYLREATMRRNTAEVEMSLSEVAAILPGSDECAGRIDLLKRLSKGLLPRELSAIEHFAAGTTLDEMGAEFGVGRERARQIQARALRKMRVNAARAGINAGAV